jgi:hypothetical protein
LRAPTAAAATSERSTSALSTSIVEIRCPETFITSSTRASGQKSPFSASVGVAGEVEVLVFGPVGVAVALVVLKDAVEHRGPVLLQHELAAARPDLVALLVEDGSLDGGPCPVACLGAHPPHG